MSTTHTAIGEHDVVVLRETVEGWPTGTKGAVVAIFPTDLWVEVVDESGENFGLVFAAPDHLELIRKSSELSADSACD